MTDPAPAQRIRNLCDQISELIETIEPAPPIAQYGANDGSSTTSAPKSPMTDNMIDARDNLKQTLTSWALLIADEKPDHIDCHDETTSIAAWIYQRADWLATHPAYTDFTHEIINTITLIHTEIDRHIDDRRFCGWHNGRPVYARHDQTHVIVDGTTYTPRQGQDRLKADIADVDLTAQACAVALKQIHGINITRRQILKMLETDQRAREAGRLGEHEGLHPVGRDGVGDTAPLLFRVSEVLSRATKRACRPGQQAG